MTPTPAAPRGVSVRLAEFMHTWAHVNAQTELDIVWPTFLVDHTELFPLLMDASRLLLFCNETRDSGQTSWEIITTYHPARSMFQVTLKGYQMKSDPT